MMRFWDKASGHAGQCPDYLRLLEALHANPTIEILVLLAHGERNVSNLAETLELDTSMISRRLRELHAYSMVEVDRRKQHHYFRLGSGVTVRVEGARALLWAKTADDTELTLSAHMERIVPKLAQILRDQRQRAEHAELCAAQAGSGAGGDPVANSNGVNHAH